MTKEQVAKLIWEEHQLDDYFNVIDITGDAVMQVLPESKQKQFARLLDKWQIARENMIEFLEANGLGESDE